MARGDVNFIQLSLVYDTAYTVRPPSGETWLITGMATSNSAIVNVLDKSDNALHIDGTFQGNSSNMQLFSPMSGGCKIFITYANYIKLKYVNTSNTPKGVNLWYVET